MKVNIYKIICEHNNYLNEIYIGSTKKFIDVRFKEHMYASKSKKYNNSKLYKLADEIGWNNFKIILIENCNVLDKKEQFKKEQEYIDLYNPTLNIISASGQSCIHKRRKYECKDCKGGRFCIHNRRKYDCKDCKGSRICEHNRIKYECKDCKGSSICIHNRIRSQCKECKGGRICEHNRIKSQCKECNNFYCDFCDKKYYSKSYLYKHILKHFYNI